MSNPTEAAGFPFMNKLMDTPVFYAVLYQHYQPRWMTMEGSTS